MTNFINNIELNLEMVKSLKENKIPLVLLSFVKNPGIIRFPELLETSVRFISNMMTFDSEISLIMTKQCMIEILMEYQKIPDIPPKLYETILHTLSNFAAEKDAFIRKKIIEKRVPQIIGDLIVGSKALTVSCVQSAAVFCRNMAGIKLG